MSEGNKVNVRLGEIVRALAQVQNLELLDKIAEMIEEEKKRQVVGYEPDGTPISHSMLLESIEEAEEDYKAGRTYSSSDIIEYFKKGEKDA